jgi:micrococcal nuclease
VKQQFKPGRQTVALQQPSRVRRAPVPIQPQVPVKKAQPRTREQELWAGVAGIVLLATACFALTIGVSAVTRSSGAPSAPPPPFNHCYNGAGPNCVWDGDTINLNGQRVEIAGMDAPEIHGAACTEESQRGIAAAVRLRELLNSGEVKVRGTERGVDGRLLTRLDVGGRDVATAMVAQDVAREYAGGPRSWCD